MSEVFSAERGWIEWVDALARSSLLFARLRRMSDLPCWRLLRSSADGEHQRYDDDPGGARRDPGCPTGQLRPANHANHSEYGLRGPCSQARLPGGVRNIALSGDKRAAVEISIRIRSGSPRTAAIAACVHEGHLEDVDVIVRAEGRLVSSNYPARWYGGNGRPRAGLTPGEQIATLEAQAGLDVARRRILDAAEAAKAQSSAQRLEDVADAALTAVDEVADASIRVAAKSPVHTELVAEIVNRARRRLGHIVEEYG